MWVFAGPFRGLLLAHPDDRRQLGGALPAAWRGIVLRP
jgi:hypothetical protein